jgi:hypothetical protein
MPTSSFHGRLTELRNNPETEKAGLKWLKEEDDKLLNEVNNKLSISDIAKIHKRTETSIKKRIMQHTINLINTEDITIENACIKMNLNIDEFKKFKEKLESKKTTNDAYMDILKEIRDLLIVISKK